MPFDTDVLIVGGGPAGLLAALTLAVHGSRSILVERNHHTTLWPKMDLTNCRSMELLRRLVVADGWRKIDSTGLAEQGETFAKWDLPSPAAWSNAISNSNDGSEPFEPYQRGSQSLFEAYLRRELDANPLVHVRYGVKLEKLSETADAVTSTLSDEAGNTVILHSKYLIGCDGGGSRVRRCLGIESIGGPAPGNMHLIHFESRDFDVYHHQGRFWHCFLTGGGVLVSQDEDKTRTLHSPSPLDTDITKVDSLEIISRIISGSFNTTVPLKVEKVLVSSVWRPNIYLSANYTSPFKCVFLAGDSAHQTVPAGGFGMNTAVGDSFDIGWKISAVLKGYARPTLLESYETERRPVAAQNLEQARKNWDVHGEWWSMAQHQGELIYQQSAEGQTLREQVRQYVETHDLENRSFGLELDYRYRDSPVIVRDKADAEPEWRQTRYTPSTWPGVRVPSVWLSDGKRNIYELLGQGPEFSIVDFTADGRYAEAFNAEAEKLNVPLRVVRLPDEARVHKMWQRDAVLVRPDDHVAWRSGLAVVNVDIATQAASALKTALGREQ